MNQTSEPHRSNGPVVEVGMAHHTSPEDELWGTEEGEGEGGEGEEEEESRGVAREQEEGGGVAAELISKWRKVVGPEREIVVSESGL